MNQLDSDGYSELKAVIAELHRKFNERYDDQLFIIEQQRDRIDYQQQQINDQRVIIEELLWQIRDLSDSVRRCSEFINKNEKSVESPTKIGISEANKYQRQSNRIEAGEMWFDILVNAHAHTRIR